MLFLPPQFVVLLTRWHFVVNVDPIMGVILLPLTCSSFNLTRGTMPLLPSPTFGMSVVVVVMVRLSAFSTAALPLLYHTWPGVHVTVTR